MNVYAVELKWYEHEAVLDDGSGPDYEGTVVVFALAASPAKAKAIAMKSPDAKGCEWSDIKSCRKIHDGIPDCWPMGAEYLYGGRPDHRQAAVQMSRVHDIARLQTAEQAVAWLHSIGDEMQLTAADWPVDAWREQSEVALDAIAVTDWLIAHAAKG